MQLLTQLTPVTTTTTATFGLSLFSTYYFRLGQVSRRRPKVRIFENCWCESFLQFGCHSRPGQHSLRIMTLLLLLLLLFLACDAMRKCGFCCRPVSVRLSRWCIVSRRLKISTNSFLGPVAPSFQFFWLLVLIPNSKGNPISGVQNTWGWEILRPSTEITIYLGNSTI